MKQEKDTTCPSLLVRVRDSSDGASWREFEERYGQLIACYCRQRGLQAADIEDVRQAVWVNLAKGLRNFEYDPQRGRFRTYLGRVVKNAIAKYFARYGSPDRALDSGVLAAAPDDADCDTDAWEQEWVKHHYRLAMEGVEASFEPRSTTLFKRLLAGDRATDLATEHGMTAAAVNQVKHRIRTRMKELIALQIREEDEPDTYAAQ